MQVKEYIKAGKLFEVVHWDGTDAEADRIVHWIQTHVGYTDAAYAYRKGELDYDLRTAAIAIDRFEDLGFSQIAVPDSYIVRDDENDFLAYSQEYFNHQFTEAETERH